MSADFNGLIGRRVERTWKMPDELVGTVVGVFYRKNSVDRVCDGVHLLVLMPDGSLETWNQIEFVRVVEPPVTIPGFTVTNLNDPSSNPPNLDLAIDTSQS